MRVCITKINAQTHYSIVHSYAMTAAQLLKLLMERAGDNPNSLSRKSKVTQSTIYRFVEGESNEPRTGTLQKLARVYGVPVEAFISEKSRIDLAKKLGLSDYGANNHEQRGSVFSVNESQAEYVGPAPKQTLIPVSGFAKLGENGWYEEVSVLGSEGYVEASSSDPDAYVLLVKGDSMHPAIRNGWYVVVEPNKQPCPGEYAAILLRDGRKMVKEYLYSNGDTITVESVNGGERLSLPKESVKVVHAIGSVIMPSKHRDL